MEQWDIEYINVYFLRLQETIDTALTPIDYITVFYKDLWQDKKEDSMETMQSLNQHSYQEFKRIGVYFLRMYYRALLDCSITHRLELVELSYQAMNSSLIVVYSIYLLFSTSYINIFFFIAEQLSNVFTWWYNSRFDLMSSYNLDKDAVHCDMHGNFTERALCLLASSDVYSYHKPWCDNFFFIRQDYSKSRGISKSLVDKLKVLGFHQIFAFASTINQSCLDTYLSITQLSKFLGWREKKQQSWFYRDSRYLVCNLILNRSMLFCLTSVRHTESILTSILPLSRCINHKEPALNSSETALYLNYFTFCDYFQE